MTIRFQQRFDKWTAVGKFPVFETENARSYAIAGARMDWLWEGFEWRTVKPTIFSPDGVDFLHDGQLMRSSRQSPGYPMMLILGVFDFPGRSPEGFVPELVVKSVIGPAG